MRDRVFDQVLQSIFWNTVNLGTGLILLFAGQAMAAGTFTVGDFALFVYYLGWITEFTALFGIILARYRQAGVSFGRMTRCWAARRAETLVAARPGLPAAARCPHVPGRAPPAAEPAATRWRCADLTYRYPAASAASRDIELRAWSAARSRSITGRIGAGKTTLLQALLGLLPRDAGEIRWNGAPVDRPGHLLRAAAQRLHAAGAAPVQRDAARQHPAGPAGRRSSICREALRLAVLEPDVADDAATGWTRWSARGACGSPAGRCSAPPPRACSCATAELLVFDDLSSALDVETENTLWERVFAHPDATCWPSRTAAPPCAAPTRSSCSRTARSRPWARWTTCWHQPRDAPPLARRDRGR